MLHCINGELLKVVLVKKQRLAGLIKGNVCFFLNCNKIIRQWNWGALKKFYLLHFIITLPFYVLIAKKNYL